MIFDIAEISRSDVVFDLSEIDLNDRWMVIQKMEIGLDLRQISRDKDHPHYAIFVRDDDFDPALVDTIQGRMSDRVIEPYIYFDFRKAGLNEVGGGDVVEIDGDQFLVEYIGSKHMILSDLKNRDSERLVNIKNKNEETISKRFKAVGFDYSWERKKKLEIESHLSELFNSYKSEFESKRRSSDDEFHFYSDVWEKAAQGF